MITTRAFASAALALGLALSGPAFAATEHAHGSDAAAVLELTLNNGQKWPTDEALRQGMGEMRSMLATSLERIQAGQFTSADYAALAARVQEQVDYVTAYCKLPEEADAQLHVVLAEILEGVDAMRPGPTAWGAPDAWSVRSKPTDGTSIIPTGLLRRGKPRLA